MEAVIGVDPHKHVLSAVALDSRGGMLGQWHGGTSLPLVRQIESEITESEGLRITIAMVMTTAATVAK